VFNYVVFDFIATVAVSSTMGTLSTFRTNFILRVAYYKSRVTVVWHCYEILRIYDNYSILARTEKLEINSSFVNRVNTFR